MTAALLLLWGTSTLLFAGLHALPGDAADVFVDLETPGESASRIRENLGLDEGFLVQYGRWLAAVARLDFQRSLVQRRPVVEILAERIPNTLALSGAALVLAFAGGIAAGTAAARRAGSVFDRAVTGGALVVASAPAFWISLMLVLVFAERARLFPASGVASIDAEFLAPLPRLLDRVRHLVLPATALAAALGATVCRFVRESVGDALASDYCRTARAKGLPERLVVRRHALRNALLPVIQLFGLHLPLLFGGSVVVETVFGWPGLGRELVQAIHNQDAPVVLGVSFGLTLLVVLGNLLADLLSVAADPRIRSEA